MTDTAITRSNSNLPIPLNSMQDAASLAMEFSSAHVLGSKNPAEGMMAVILVNELGLVKANANYQIMMGTISKKAHAILADFVRTGGTYRIIKRDPECASMFAKHGLTEGEFSFTWDQAKEEPFIYTGSPSEQRGQLTVPFEERELKAKYATPRSRMQMLWARLISDTCNALCPEANEGMYPPEIVADFSEVTDDKGGNAGAAIDVTEAQERVDNVKPDTVDPAEPAEPAEPVIDYTLCPLGAHSAWDTFTTEQLDKAMVSDKPEITTTHKAAIRLVMETRTEKGAK